MPPLLKFYTMFCLLDEVTEDNKLFNHHFPLWFTDRCLFNRRAALSNLHATYALVPLGGSMRLPMSRRLAQEGKEGAEGEGQLRRGLRLPHRDRAIIY